MNRPRPLALRGFSLVELLATITVLTILLGLCAGLIRLLLRLDQSSRDALVVAADAHRLARDFRDDAHRATSTPPAPGSDRVAWTTADDEKVEYSVQPRGLLREVKRGGKVRHRETYRLPPRSDTRFEISPGGGPALLSIVTRRSTGAPGGPVVGDDRITAEFGRNPRLIARQP